MLHNLSIRCFRFSKPILNNTVLNVIRLCRFSFDSKHKLPTSKALMDTEVIVSTHIDSTFENSESPVIEADANTNRNVIRPKIDPGQRIALSFSACGFLGSYHFGVMGAFHKNGKKLLERVDKCAGASAGSLIAALLVLAPHKFNDGLNLLYELATEINSYSFGALNPGFYLAERLVHIVEPFIPEDISPAQNKLYISVTNQSEYYQIMGQNIGFRRFGANRIISTFPSREYLIKCLMASCYIPIYSGGFYNDHPPPILDGQPYIDGGFSNILPTFEDIRTITVSPFSGDADISPRDPLSFGSYEWKTRIGNQLMRANLQNLIRGAQSLFPPNHASLKTYCDMGFRDAMSFLLRNGYLEREQGTEV